MTRRESILCLALLAFSPSADGLSVRLVDAVSKRPVILVGTMHYNPASVALAAQTIREVSQQEGLHSVAIELCSSRWNSSVASRWSREPSLKRMLSEDEFQVAFETARDVGLLDVVLADQEIRETGSRLGAALLRTAKDAATPGGWRRITADLGAAAVQVPAFMRGASSVRLASGTPMALARYLYQSPAALPFLAFSAAALSLAALVDEASGVLPAAEDGVISALVAALLGRSVYVALIEERNHVLARNIRASCVAAGATHGGSAAVDGADAAGAADEDAAVVAVIGMAHLAGVREALLRPAADQTERLDC